MFLSGKNLRSRIKLGFMKENCMYFTRVLERRLKCKSSSLFFDAKLLIKHFDISSTLKKIKRESHFYSILG